MSFTGPCSLTLQYLCNLNGCDFVTCENTNGSLSFRSPSAIPVNPRTEPAAVTRVFIRCLVHELNQTSRCVCPDRRRLPLLAFVSFKSVLLSLCFAGFRPLPPSSKLPAARHQPGTKQERMRQGGGGPYGSVGS
ncbi:hypothetical protein H6P81_019615 [Aristolochia fimbriata]|uniref:Uncharacterized protein n=1 Tax=Aristolochia fimbriata TaxID=158543 RepID=A0AAV7DTT3_ARIFI|nr:hypothetical protein H6P81_019615 [Aristolochia fimbriata]